MALRERSWKQRGRLFGRVLLVGFSEGRKSQHGVRASSQFAIHRAPSVDKLLFSGRIRPEWKRRNRIFVMLKSTARSKEVKHSKIPAKRVGSGKVRSVLAFKLTFNKR